MMGPLEAVRAQIPGILWATGGSRENAKSLASPFGVSAGIAPEIPVIQTRLERT